MEDMLSATQMLWRRYPGFTPSVVSLPNGANIKAVADNLEFINLFEEVLICTDNDIAGKKVAKDIAQLVGGKAKMVSLSEKDANDMLLEGKSKEFINSFFRAKSFLPDGIVRVSDVYDEAIKMPEFGRRWPWPSLDKLTYGRRPGEGIYVAGAVKSGKTECLSQMV